MNKFSQKGISIVEIIIAISILSAVVAFIGYSITLYIDARDRMLSDTVSLYLIEEGYELARSIRDEDWNDLDTLTLDTEYGFDVDASSIGVDLNPEIINGAYRRTFELRALYRDSDGDVVASTTTGSAVDTEGREILITVGSEKSTSTMKAIITNVFAS